MDWPRIENPDAIPSPALLVEPERVATNIAKMVATVGSGAIGRLRPHVKTHKMPQVMRLQLEAGIDKFKAATIAELKMAAGAGARDLLMAYQPVGPNIRRLRELIDAYPQTSFAAVTDEGGAARAIAEELGSEDRPFRLFIDVDCGMHRTGAALGPGIDALRGELEADPRLEFAGLHVYDGHLHAPSLERRREGVCAIRGSVQSYLDAHPAPAVIVSGTPTFAIWAAECDWQCSPGTTLFWDLGYGRAYPDLEFELAACLLTRVISKPGSNRVCIDLGHKAVAAENPLERRVFLQGLPDARPIAHSEEHLVLETPDAESIEVGQVFLGFPQHICPTVALHATAHVIRDGRATGEQWEVAARNR